MTYSEEHRDLFGVDDSYYLAHCIAADLRMGVGIAVPMQKAFGLRKQILESGKKIEVPTCILTGRVFNLITKARSNGKPSYHSLTGALMGMEAIARYSEFEKIAMPKIGCGLDRLKWAKVRAIIEDMFKGSDVEILVCMWP